MTKRLKAWWIRNICSKHPIVSLDMEAEKDFSLFDQYTVGVNKLTYVGKGMYQVELNK